MSQLHKTLNEDRVNALKRAKEAELNNNETLMIKELSYSEGILHALNLIK